METTRLTGFREADPEERWQQQYRDLEAIQQTLTFYAEELVFLRTLIDRHLMWLMEEDSLTHLQSLTARITGSAAACTELQHTASGLIGKTGALIENPFAQDEHQLRMAFAQIRQSLETYTEGLRLIKKDVYQVMEAALRTEKARRMLPPHESTKS